MRILLVDDDDALMETLAQALIGQRYAVDIAGDGETAQEFVALFSYDLLILDMLLPDTDGLTLCQQLRKEGMTSPILMLTAQDDHQNKVQALDAGADDYVVKPFDFDELCARVRALLRRNTHLAESVLQWGPLSLNPVTLDVAYGDQPLHMTPKEYALLELFLRHPSRVFSLDAIIDNLWSFEDPPSGDAVRTHIKGLRQKLKAGGAPKNFVETVYGLGYRLRPLEEQTTAPAKVTQPSKADISAAVAKAWESHQGTMQERLSVLEATAAALDIGRLSTELQQAGRSQAHKLAGSLGCFGFSKGSKLARELERLLELDAPLGEQHVSRVSHLLQDLRQTLAHGSSQQVVSAAISSSPQILIVGPSEGFTQDIVADALAVGLRSTTALDPVQAAEMLVSCPPPGQSPDAAVIWVDEANYAEALALVGAIAPRPILLVSDIQDFQQRLQLVQQGAERILPTATAVSHIVKDVRQLLQAGNAARRVVIVDDDPEVLEFVTTILDPWGFQLTALERPTQLWQTLDKLRPDLLILDVEMPEASGLELCQVLRADDRWRHLPILFLTAHEDINTQQQAFNVGADDFVSKATMAADLPGRILNRLKRTQL